MLGEMLACSGGTETSVSPDAVWTQPPLHWLILLSSSLTVTGYFLSASVWKRVSVDSR